MNRIYLDKFIDQLVELARTSDKSDYVQDSLGRYNKVLFLEDLILQAKSLITYGENKIALENMLENLNEVSIRLDKNIVSLARQAFGEQISPNMENLLNALTK